MKFWVKALAIAPIVLALQITGLAVFPAIALDANAQNSQSGAASSMEDVARMIRRGKKWQILKARPKQDGTLMIYEFRVINRSGQVKNISVDPRRPSLKRLEQ